MWMRVIRSHGLTSQKIKPVVDAYRREDLPQIRESPGFLGIVLGENHNGGSIGSVTFWEDEESLRESDRYSTEARERALPMFGASDPMLIDRFEVTYTRMLTPWASSRRSWLRLVRFRGLTGDTIDAAANSYRDDAERHLNDTPGVEGVAVGANHEDGTVAVITGWESSEALTRAERISTEARERAVAAAGVRPTPLVDHFEITIASGLSRLGSFADKVG